MLCYTVLCCIMLCCALLRYVMLGCATLSAILALSISGGSSDEKWTDEFFFRRLRGRGDATKNGTTNFFFVAVAGRRAQNFRLPRACNENHNDFFFSSPNVAPVQTGARFFFVAVFRGSFRRLRGAVPSPTSFGLERLPESNAGPPVSSMKKAPKRLQNRPRRAFRDT